MRLESDLTSLYSLHGIFNLENVPIGTRDRQLGWDSSRNFKTESRT